MSNEDLLVRIGLTEKQYLASIARLERQSTRAAKGAERAFGRQNRSFVRGARQADRAASGFASNGLRQMSMQFSQVAQQGAVTGNYLQALAIQAPDLALGFGAIGIAVGAVVPVLYGVAQGLFQTAETAEDAQKAFDQLSGGVETLSGGLDAIRGLQERYAEAVVNGQTEVATALASEIRMRTSILEIRRAEVALDVEAAQAAARANEERLQRLRAAAAEEGNNVRDFDARGTEFVRTAADRERLEAVQAVFDANREMLLEIRRQAAELDLQEHLLEQIDIAIRDATASAESLGDGMADVGASAAGAADEVDRLRRTLASAGQGGFSARILAANPEFFDPRSPRHGVIPDGVLPDEDNAPASTPRRRSASSGAGQSDAERERARAIAEVERVVQRTRTKVEAYQQSLRDLRALRPFFEQEGEIESYNRALADLNQQFQQSQHQELVNGINSVSDAMAQAIVRGEDMGSALRGVFQQLAVDLVASGIRRSMMAAFGFSGFGALFGAPAAVPSYASGTNFHPGGLARINDGGGGEIVNLPRGTQVIPHDVSMAMAQGGAQHIELTIGVDQSGNLRPFVRNEAANVSVQIVGAAQREQNRALPGRVQSSQKRGT